MKLSQLKIDPEFQSKIPPLQFEEEQQLEQNIIAEGRESHHHKEWLHSGWAEHGRSTSNLQRWYGIAHPLQGLLWPYQRRRSNAVCDSDGQCYLPCLLYTSDAADD